MKYIILVMFFVFSPQLIAGTVPNSNAALIPIISYILLDSASNIIGTLDSTFNSDGIAVYDSPYVVGASDTGNSIVLDGDKNIYVTGYSYNADGDGSMAIWKYDGDGNLDTTFGNNGFVVYHNAACYGSAIVWDGAENIYVTGYSYNADNNSDMAIWKYNLDGSLDTTFGSGGIVVHHGAAGGDYHDDGKAIAYNSATGHIYVTGSSWGNSLTNLDMVIWKYDSDGNLDTTFDSDGFVAHHNAAGGGYKDYGRGIVLDSSGNIYVTGSSDASEADERVALDMTIWKYSSTGILDNTFGNGGIVVHRNAAGGTVDDEGKSIVLDSDGNIYVTGHSGNGHDNDMVIWKYSSTGILDVTFDDDGIVVHDGAAGGNSFDYGYAIVLDSTDNIYVTGTSRQISFNFDMIIWKYNSTGSLDNTFDSDGIVVHNGAAGGNGYDYGNAVVLDSTDNIYVTGFSTNAAGNWDMVIWKYK